MSLRRSAALRALVVGIAALTLGSASLQAQTTAPALNPPATAPSPSATPTPAPSPSTATTTAQQHIINQMLDVKMSLGDGHKLWHPTRGQLGLSVTLGASPHIDVDAAKTKAYLVKLAKALNRGPQKPHIIFPENYPLNEVDDRSSNVPLLIKIAPAQPGVSLDVDASVQAVQAAIAANPVATHIVLAVNTTTVPAADLTKFDGINARIAHFVTHYNPAEKGRTQTVRLAINLIDGHMVQPGDTFSVNKVVGERTAARGFGTGIVFVDGHLDTQLGGGMCQVATTLFNAALLANLKIVERYQHVRTIPYVKPGQDATVYYGQKDFIFKNSTSTPIYISYKITATHCICDLYGSANPSVKVRIVDEYQKLGPRDYTAVLKRYVSENGKTKVDYTAKSAYKWTPALDFSM